MSLIKKKRISYYIQSTATLLSTFWGVYIKFFKFARECFFTTETIIIENPTNGETISQATESFTSLGAIVTFIVIVYALFSISYTFYLKRKEITKIEKQKKKIIKQKNIIEFLEYEYDVLDNELTYTTKLLSSISSITDSNTREYYDNFQTGSKFVFDIDKELNSAIEEMVNYFSDMTAINRQMIGASLLYTLNIGDDGYEHWRMYPAIHVENTLTKEELLKNKMTTARRVIDTKKNIFYIDKRKAIELGEYVADAKDEENDCVGSIICRNISIKDSDNNHNCVEAVLTVTSHGEQIIDEEDTEAKKVILNDIMLHYEIQIKEVLAKIYLINKGKFTYIDTSAKSNMD